MISPLSGTALKKRCTRCGNQFLYNERHQCDTPVDGPAGAQVAAVAAVRPPAAVTKDGAERPTGEEGADPVLGAVLGERYLMQRRLSQGGMGVVYKARHVLLDSPVAVKILLQPQDQVAQQRFLQEAKMASTVRHPNTVYISDFGVLSDGRSYLVMELLKGPTLSRCIAEGAMDVLRACRIAAQIATGLQAVHDKGIVHRDLKPENIFLVEQDGVSDFVKIVDFGIARRALATPSSDPNVSSGGLAPAVSADSLTAVQAGLGISQPGTSTVGNGPRLTLDGTIMGTPHYMSPEQATGVEVDARSDQYALGCILYEMLTGGVPFDGAPQSILAKHVTVPVPVMSERRPPKLDPVPSPVEKIVLRLLAKEPEGRFPAMRDAAKALQREIDGMLLSRGERVLIAKSAAEVLTGGRPPRVLSIFGRYIPLWVLALPLLAVVGAATWIVARQVVSGRAPSDRLADGELMAARKAALDVLTAQLRAAEPETRLSVLAGVGTTHDLALRAVVEESLGSAVPEVQAQAAAALGQLGDRKALPALRRAVGAGGPVSVQVAIAGALDQLGDPEGGRLLRQALSGADPVGRQRAAYVLVEQGDRAAQDLLAAVAAAPDVPEEQLIRILARLAQSGDSSARTQLRERLIVQGRHEHKLLAAAKLAQLGDEQGRAFLKALAAQGGPDQLPAARLLSTPDDPTGLPLFRRVVADRHATAASRKLASEGLGQSGQAIDVRLLQPLLAGGSDVAGGDMARTAAVAILQIGGREPSTLSEQSMAWARLALDDSDWVVRQSAAAVLGESSSDKATALLGRLLHDPEVRVRRTAVRALGRRTDRAALLALRDSLADEDGSVRLEALRAIGKLGQALTRLGLPGLLSEAQAWLHDLGDRGSPQEQLLASAALLRMGDSNQRDRLRTFQLAENVEVRKLLIENIDGDSDLVTAALADEAWPVRLAAARRLAERGDRRAIPVLQEALTRGGTTATAAYALLRRLGEKPQPPADADLTSPAAPLETRLALLESLSRAPVDVALPALSRAVRDRDAEVRRSVAEIAAELPSVAGQPAGLPILRQLAEDSDPTVRARAEALLARLLAPPAATEGPVAAAAPSATATPPSEPAATSPTPTPAPTTGPAEPAGGTAPDKADSQPEKRTPLEKGGDGEGVATDSLLARGAEQQPAELLRKGVQSLEQHDFEQAQRLLEKARKLCGKGRRAGCATLGFDVSYQLARLHESQGHSAEAMQEYERVVKQASTISGRDKEKTSAQEAVLRLVPKLGVIVMPKQQGGSCREVSLWMPPGTHEVVVNGQTQTITVKAHETIRAGSCP